MQQGNFIDIFLARLVSGTYGHHQGALDVELLCMVFLHRVFGWVVVLRATVWVVCTVRMVTCGTIRTVHSSCQDHHPSKN